MVFVIFLALGALALAAAALSLRPSPPRFEDMPSVKWEWHPVDSRAAIDLMDPAANFYPAWMVVSAFNRRFPGQFPEEALEEGARRNPGWTMFARLGAPPDAAEIARVLEECRAREAADPPGGGQNP